MGVAKKNLKEALDQVEMTYEDLADIAKDMSEPFFKSANDLIKELSDIQNLSNDAIRDYMIRLAINSYSLGEVKEKAAFKAECAEALRKETYAQKYYEAEGTVGAKDTLATMESASEIVVEALYKLVSSLFKVKMIEIHQMVDVLKSIMMSRMQEAKLSMNNSVD